MSNMPPQLTHYEQQTNFSINSTHLAHQEQHPSFSLLRTSSAHLAQREQLPPPLSAYSDEWHSPHSKRALHPLQLTRTSSTHLAQREHTLFGLLEQAAHILLNESNTPSSASSSAYLELVLF